MKNRSRIIRRISFCNNSFMIISVCSGESKVGEQIDKEEF